MKKITSKDVAIASGVSQSLVSLIINNVPDMKIKAETRQHVLEIAKQMNYSINMNAKGMKSRKANAIGLLSSWDANSFVFPPIIKGVQSVCEECNYSIVICTGKKTADNVPDFVTYHQQNRIDALIYISYVGVKSDDIIQSLNHYNIPFVCVIGARDISDVSSVDVNFYQSGYMATQHLINQQYNQIGFILPNQLEMLNYAELERLHGCEAATQSNGLSLKTIPLYDTLNPQDEETSIMHAMTFLSQTQLNAFIGTSYSCFILLKAAARLSINIPADLGVISLDNELYAPYLYPSLTTIDEPLTEMAQHITHLLFDKINGSEICTKQEFMPTLTIRESTNRNLH